MASKEAPANVRVLVRVRPLNDKERSQRGSGGRASVLTVDAGSASSTSCIDFGVNSGERDSSSGTVTVHGVGGGSDDDNVNGKRRRPSNGGFTSDSGYGSGSERKSSGSASGKSFTFDAVHGPRSTQTEVFESVKGIVDVVAAGYNGTIVAYGQTGSGKTHTVFGSGSSDESGAGLVQRSLRTLFNKIALSQAQASVDGEHGLSPEKPVVDSLKTTTRASFFEIFNEKVYDLLSGDSLESPLPVREDSTKGVYVEGLEEVEVKSTADAEEVLCRGAQNRHVAATAMNRTSSRSHAVFVLSVKTVQTSSDGLSKVRVSKFSLVDLAGSERQKSTDAAGERLKEASMINKSLLCLGHVINALVDCEHGKQRHVPFRNSKLTFLLRDSWGGNSKTCLVATVSPSSSSLSETLSTLNFAQRAKLIKNRAVLNEDTCGTVASLQAEVCRLRAELRQAAETSCSSARSSASSSKLPPKPSVRGRECEQNAYDARDSDNEIVLLALRRKARQAEEEAERLNRKVSERNEIVRSLKRKLHEETMVRKLKQRRIDNLTEKKSAGYDEEVSALCSEIDSLRRQLDAPSADAIEWKVAYDQLREEMEKKDISIKDDADLNLDNGEHLDAIERLLDEKTALEGKIEELSKSKAETREEVDMIIREVDRLEKEAISLKEQVQKEKKKARNAECRASLAETETTSLHSELSCARKDIEKIRKDYQRERGSSSQLESEIVRLMDEVDKKDEYIADIEAKKTSIENELKSNLEDLIKQLEESNSKLKHSQVVEEDLRKDIARSSENNEILMKQIQDKSSENDRLKSRVDELEVMLKGLEEEKVSLRKERDAIEDTLNMKMRDLDHMQHNHLQQTSKLKEMVSDLDREKERAINLNITIEQLRSEMETALEEAAEKQKEAKEAYKAKISSLELEKEKILVQMTSMETDAKTRELQKAEAENLASKISQIEAEKNVALTKAKREKDDIQSALKDEVNLLKAELRVMTEKENVWKTDNSIIEELKNDIKKLEKEKDIVVDEKIKEKEEMKSVLQAKLDSLEVDFSSLKEKYSKMEDIQSELGNERAQVCVLKNVIKQLEDETAAALNKSNEEKDSMRATLEEKIFSVGAERDNVIKQLDSLQITLGELQQEKQKADVLHKKVEELEEGNANALEKASKEMGEFQMRMKQEIDEIKKEKDSLEGSEKELNEQRKRVAQLEQTIEGLKDEHRITLDKLELERRNAESALDSRVSALKAERKTLLDKVAMNEEMSIKLKNEEEKNCEMETTIKQLEMEKSDILTNAKEEKKKYVIDFNEQAKILEAERKVLAQKIAKLDQISNELSEQNSKVSALTVTNEQLQKKINRLEQLKEEENNVESLQSEITSLENERGKSAKQIICLQKMSEEDSKKINLLTDQLKLVKKARDSLQIELSSSQSNVDGLVKDSKALEKQYHELQKENNRLKKLVNGQDRCTDDSLGHSKKKDSPAARNGTQSMSSSLSGEDMKHLTTSGQEHLSEPLQKNSTSHNKANKPFADLSAKMDNVINRMSTGDSCEDPSMEDSFDESMFLPNVDEGMDEKENDIPTIMSGSSRKRKNIGDGGTSTPLKVSSNKKKFPLSPRSQNTTVSDQISTTKYPSFTANKTFRSGW